MINRGGKYLSYLRATRDHVVTDLIWVPNGTPPTPKGYFSLVRPQVKADQFCLEGRNVRHVLCEGPEQMLCCSFMTAFAKWFVSQALGSQVKLC